MSPSLEPVREFLEMCDATRRSLPAEDQDVIDDRSAAFRDELTTIHELDLTDPEIIAAVTAGVIQGMGATIEHGEDAQTVHRAATRASLALGWVLYDLAVAADSCTASRCGDALGCPGFVPTGSILTS
jgi:hypothetical protein